MFGANVKSMAVQTCPTDVVAASAERVWALLVSPEQLETWADVKVVDAPRRPLEPGDRLVLAAGPGRLFRVIFEVCRMRRPEHFELDIRLPFGITNHEVITINPLDARRCRVTYS